jgi:hypothetical protein
MGAKLSPGAKEHGILDLFLWIGSVNKMLAAIFIINNSHGLLLANFAFQSPPNIVRKLLVCYWVQIQGRGVSAGQIIFLIY